MIRLVYTPERPTDPAREDGRRLLTIAERFAEDYAREIAAAGGPATAHPALLEAFAHWEARAAAIEAALEADDPRLLPARPLG